MTQSTFCFYIGLVAGGIVCIAFMIRQIYLALRKGSIERRLGLRPVTPHDGAALFWAAIVILVAGTIIGLWGIAVVMSRLLNA